MSHYSAYMAEMGVGILENKYGFATYVEQKDPILEEKVMYIRDIYVAKQFRKELVASELADEIAKIAKEQGIKYLLGSSDLNAPNVELSFKAQMGYGFKVHSYHENMIYWIKEIR